jgi:hypothetical protein
MSSILVSRMLKIVPALAIGVASALVGGDARADEIAPQLSIQSMIVQVSHASDNANAFTCVVAQQSADGSFTCSNNASASGKITGVTNQFGVVVGHRIRMTHVSAAATDTYVGAIERQTGPGLVPVWMAGERTTTSIRRSCSGLRCITVTVTDGPRPFVGEAFYLGG